MSRIIYLTFVAATILATTNAAGEKSLPFSEVKAFVEQTLESKPNYKPGDLITTAEVLPILQQLAKSGVRFDPKMLYLEVFLQDQSPLATLLRTPKNIPLMREIAKKPEDFDRLERLTRFPAGLKLVRQAFESPDQFAAVRTLCSDEALPALAERFVDEPSAKNLEVNSGGIYTQQQLLDHLELMLKLADKNLTRPGD